MTIKDRDRLFARCEGLTLDDLPNLLRAIVEELPVDHPQRGKVRCWRGAYGPMWHDGTDRIRVHPDGGAEWVWPDGRTELCEPYFNAEYCEGRAREGHFAECPDEPYRPAPVPAPAPTMPDCVRELVEASGALKVYWAPSKKDYNSFVRDTDRDFDRLNKAIAACRSFYGEVQP